MVKVRLLVATILLLWVLFVLELTTGQPVMYDDDEYLIRTLAEEDSDTYASCWMIPSTASFVFEVQACEGAMISLETVPGDRSKPYYEVRICDELCTVSSVWRSVDNSTHGEVATPDILDCDAFKPFWIQWDPVRHEITAGYGDSIGWDQILQYTDNEPSQYVSDIVALSLATRFNGVGTWTFGNGQGRVVQSLVYADRNEYENLQRSVNDRPWVFFGIQQCKDAMISLGNSSHNAKDGLYEIVIGGSGNGFTGIREGVLGEYVASEWTDGVLSCDEMRYFWLSWEAGLIEVGKGHTRGQQILVFWQSPTLHNISVVSITGYDDDGLWSFRANDDNALLVRTPASLPYITTGREEEYVRFKARGCEEAVVVLRSSTTPAGNPVYEVTLGSDSNNQTLLRVFNNSGDHMVDAMFSTNDIMSCDNYRTFWLSWGGGKVRLGTHELFTNQLFEFDDPEQTRSIGSVTFGEHTQPTEWEIPRGSDALSNTIELSGNYSYDGAWLSVLGSTDVVMNVVACKDASVILATYMGVATVNTYEVVFGAQDNTKAIIKKDGITVVEQDQADLVSCTYGSPLWVSWKDGKIAVGTGFSAGSPPIMEFTDQEGLYAITALGLSSGDDAKAVFSF